MLDPITPQKNPDFFYTRTIRGHEYYVPNYVTWELKRNMERAAIEAYRVCKPEECKPDIDPLKFGAWALSDEGKIAVYSEEAKILFIPKDNAPPVDFRMIPFYTFEEARNFFDRPLPDSDSRPTDATAKNEKKRAKK